MRAHLVVTPGDPRGIGPEVALRALERFESENPDVLVVLVGPEGAVDRSHVASHPVRWHGWRGGSDAEAGMVAARSIERAVALAMSGEAHAVVTAPLHKPSLQAAGWSAPGQTELLRDLAGSSSVGMLMAAEHTRLDGPLRVLLATRHVPLREVSDRLSASLLVEQSALLHDALRSDWGLAEPRLALCALNPHASDGGLFGTEEAEVYAPALDRIRASGILVEGPLPADTVFTRALAGEFDAVVAPYHDVGMAAFKTVAFGSGVNVTLGLPFVRTSPDHGTAFDLAGAGTADPTSMLEALRLAARLSHTRFDTASADVLT